MPKTFELYNTIARSAVPLSPADPACVTFYSCGPTVYDDAHIGNFRSFLAADLLRRWIESPLCTLIGPDGSSHQGPRRVIHVMNITDVGHMTDDDAADGGGEDKMELAAQRLLEQKKQGSAHASAQIDPSDPFQIAAFYADRFLDDAKRLGLKVAIESEQDPTLMPRATQKVVGSGGMVEMIEKLIERGAAYVVGDAGSQTVYFSVESSPDYGALSGNTLDQVRSGAGGRLAEDNQTEKRHPADFLLWKSDPSHLMKWPSPWGDGYPGWHIECSAMALDRLDPSGSGMIDLHSGGEDNIFPHHECERAQSCAVTGCSEFSRHWFHARYLMVEGQKMSKSKGTFYTARELFEQGHEPAAIRLALISAHYRKNMDFSVQGLKDAARTIERWRGFLARAEEPAAPEQDASAEEMLGGFSAMMHDDLNIAGALGVLNAWIGSAKPSAEGARALRTIDGVLGVLSLEAAKSAETDIGVFLAGLDPDPSVVEKLIARREAKKAKDFASADAIRDELLGMGLAIKDVAGGKVEVSRA